MHDNIVVINTYFWYDITSKLYIDEYINLFDLLLIKNTTCYGGLLNTLQIKFIRDLIKCINKLKQEWFEWNTKKFPRPLDQYEYMRKNDYYSSYFEKLKKHEIHKSIWFSHILGHLLMRIKFHSMELYQRYEFHRFATGDEAEALFQKLSAQHKAFIEIRSSWKDPV